MAQKQKRSPKRWRSKETREIVSAVEKAGGTVELTGKGHLRVTGPAGIAFVASALDTGRSSGRGAANVRAIVERETGLLLAPQTVPSPGKANPESPPPSAQPQKRHGEITRWNSGDTCGFITCCKGKSWFVSRGSLPGGLSELPPGTRVMFTGSPKPKPGKPYPEALRIWLAPE